MERRSRARRREKSFVSRYRVSARASASERRLSNESRFLAAGGRMRRQQENRYSMRFFSGGRSRSAGPPAVLLEWPVAWPLLRDSTRRGNSPRSPRLSCRFSLAVTRASAPARAAPNLPRMQPSEVRMQPSEVPETMQRSMDQPNLRPPQRRDVPERTMQLHHPSRRSMPLFAPTTADKGR